MPEFEDNSILGESIYHAVQFGPGGRGHGEEGDGRLNMKMFEQEPHNNNIDSEDRGENLAILHAYPGLPVWSVTKTFDF